MSELPNKNNFFDQFGDIYDVLARLPGVLAPVNAVVSGGTITPISGAIMVDSENQAASDDLNNISTANMPEGAWVFIRGLNPQRVVTLRHKTGGNGELNLSDNNFALDAADKWIILERKGADWFEVLRGPVRSCGVGNALPLALGTAAAGEAVNAAREDHVHPKGALVEGPASASANHIPKFADSTGKVLADGYTVGTEANNLVQLDNNAKLPAVDGSALTGLAAVAKTGSYNDLINKPTLGTAAALDVGTSANNVVQLDNNAKLPAVDGSQLTNLPAGGISGCNIVTFTSSGTWTKPTGLKFIKVYVIGGGGHYGDQSGGQLGCGGAGGMAIKIIAAGNLASTVAVTVGNYGNPDGGGNSSFGTHCSATGGSGGRGNTDSVGGIGSGGDINVRGESGRWDGATTITGGSSPLFPTSATTTNERDTLSFGQASIYGTYPGKGVVIIEEYI